MHLRYGKQLAFVWQIECFSKQIHYHLRRTRERYICLAKITKYYQVSKVLAVRTVSGDKEYLLRWKEQKKKETSRT